MGLTLMVVDHDELGADCVSDVIEAARYPNHCISPSIASIETTEVEWTDSHPLNRRDGWKKAWFEAFPR